MLFDRRTRGPPKCFEEVDVVKCQERSDTLVCVLSAAMCRPLQTARKTNVCSVGRKRRKKGTKVKHDENDDGEYSYAPRLSSFKFVLPIDIHITLGCKYHQGGRVPKMRRIPLL
jgi:hypothetical protein